MSRVFHTQLRYERERRGWSRNYVAEQVEVDVATVGRWERGERLPYPHYRQQICALFELSAQEMGLYIESAAESNEATPMLSISEESTISAIPEKYSIPATPQVELPAKKQDDRADKTLVHPRRKFLIGLGGIGTITLLFGGLWMVSSRNLSQPPNSSKPLSQLTDPNTANWINNLAWSPDGSLLAVANSVPLVTAWNVTKVAIADYYPTLDQWVNDVTWSPNNRIASATASMPQSTGTIQIWTFLDTVHPLYTLPRAYGQRTVSWSPDGEYLAFAGHYPLVEIWGPINKPVSQYLPTDPKSMGINRVKWSADAAYLAAAADNGDVYVWETSTYKLQTIYHGHTERVVDIVWITNGYHIASASVDHTVHIWDATNGQPITIYRGHTGEVHGVDCSPDGKYVVSAGYSTSAQVWNALTGECIMTYGGPNNQTLCVLWSLDGRTIALGNKKNGVEIWQAPT